MVGEVSLGRVVASVPLVDVDEEVKPVDLEPVVLLVLREERVVLVPLVLPVFMGYSFTCSSKGKTISGSRTFSRRF